MDLSKIISGVLDVAEKVAPLLEGTPAAPIVNIGKAVVDLIDETKAVAGSNDQAALQARRDELEPRVLAHLDRTIESLD